MSTLKKIILIFVIMILILNITSCSANRQSEKPLFKINDYYNREISFEKAPEKIISLAPNISEIICDLGKFKLLAARTNYCDYPSTLRNISSVGDMAYPDIEKIININPDLVIASDNFKKEACQKLEEVGIKVVVLRSPKSFEGTYEIIKKIGKILKTEDEAEKIVNEIKNKIKNISNKVKGKRIPRVYYVMSFGKYGDFTAGKDTFISQMINMAGGKNVADDITGWNYNLESLISKDPDILICSKNFNAKNEIKISNGYKELTAVKQGRLYEIDNNLLERQGPRLAEGLVALARIIHPEVNLE